MEKSGRYDTVDIDGLQVRALRERNSPRLAQGRLAELAGVSRGYISQIEREPRLAVSRRVAAALAEALATKVEALAPLGGFSFPAPRRSPRRGDVQDHRSVEDVAELRRILAEIDRLRAMVEGMLRERIAHD